MPHRLRVRFFLLLLGVSGVFVSCVPPMMMGGPYAPRPYAPRQYAQATDSATSACLRNPACYAPPAGEAPILPWVSRSLEAARAASALLKLLEAADLAKITQVLSDCANQASREVDDRLL